MVARRKKATRRKKRTFSVNVLDLGAGLAFADAANAGTAAQQMLKGDVQAGLKTLSSSFQDNKTKMVAIAAGSIAAKLITRSVGAGQFAAIGPLKLRA